jgi:hypothetical protein
MAGDENWAGPQLRDRGDLHFQEATAAGAIGRLGFVEDVDAAFEAVTTGQERLAVRLFM